MLANNFGVFFLFMTYVIVINCYNTDFDREYNERGLYRRDFLERHPYLARYHRYPTYDSSRRHFRGKSWDRDFDERPRRRYRLRRQRGRSIGLRSEQNVMKDSYEQKPLEPINFSTFSMSSGQSFTFDEKGGESKSFQFRSTSGLPNGTKPKETSYQTNGYDSKGNFKASQGQAQDFHFKLIN